MPRKYQPLAAYLAVHPGDRLKLTFCEIEQLVRGDLPPGSLTRLWWSNAFPSAAQSWGWRSVGWRVETVDLRRQMVTFVRLKQLETP